MRFPSLLLLSVIACGGSVASSTTDGGDTSDASADATQGGNDSGLLFGDAGVPSVDADIPDTGVCGALATKAFALQPAAEKCCPTCNVAQCTQTIRGPCCPVRVDDVNSPDVQAFLAAVSAYRAANCVCMVSCPVPPQGQCDPQTSECR